MYIKKSYCLKNGKMISFAGHIKKEIAIKRKFDYVSLVIIDTSGKGRWEQRDFDIPFSQMKSFN
jgi:hypothetical protein